MSNKAGIYGALGIAGMGVLIITCILLLVINGIANDIQTTPEEPPASAVAAEKSVTPQAERILREMGNYLKAAKEFTFTVEIAYDTMSSDGQKIQYGGVSNVSVRRPDKIRAIFKGDERQTQSFYDGKTFTILNTILNVYAQADVPPTIDDAVDAIFEKYGFSVPIADFVYSDPYEVLMEQVKSGYVVGKHAIDGILCNHLAFSQDEFDWQIWIEDGPRPLPRKFIITYKKSPGWPQYTAKLSKWDSKPELPDTLFVFEPQADHDQFEFLIIEEELPILEEEQEVGGAE